MSEHPPQFASFISRNSPTSNIGSIPLENLNNTSSRTTLTGSPTANTKGPTPLVDASGNVVFDTSYSGCDITVYAVMNYSGILNKTVNDGHVIRQLGEVQTLSYSAYRDKEAVRALGVTSIKGVTRGPVTFAGTMVFTVLKERVLNELINSISEPSTDTTDKARLFSRIDQMPPIDLFILFQNEFGYKSRMSILGVEFMNEGQVMSVADLITENSTNYIARYISPLREVSSYNEDLAKDLAGGLVRKTTPEAITKEEYSVVKLELDKLKEMWL